MWSEFIIMQMNGLIKRRNNEANQWMARTKQKFTYTHIDANAVYRNASAFHCSRSAFSGSAIRWLLYGTQSRANHGPRIVRHTNSGERCPQQHAHTRAHRKESNDFIPLVRLISIEAINTITNIVAQLYLAAIEFLIVSGFIRVSAPAKERTKTFFVPGRWLRHKNNCAAINPGSPLDYFMCRHFVAMFSRTLNLIIMWAASTLSRRPSNTLSVHRSQRGIWFY